MRPPRMPWAAAAAPKLTASGRREPELSTVRLNSVGEAGREAWQACTQRDQGLMAASNTTDLAPWSAETPAERAESEVSDALTPLFAPPQRAALPFTSPGLDKNQTRSRVHPHQALAPQTTQRARGDEPARAHLPASSSAVRPGCALCAWNSAKERRSMSSTWGGG